MKIELKENEKIDDLELNNLKIIQNKDWFCFGMDSVILSDFAKNIKNNSNIIDLGTGTGILPILLSQKTNAKKLVGIEIQNDVANMAQRSIYLNNLEDKIEIICEDLKNIKKTYENKTFDVVVTNPPYKKIGTGITNENENKLISRHEITANLEDFISASSYLLKDLGTLYMVNRAERLVDVICLLKKYKIEPKEITFVQSNKNKEPNIFLIKAVKHAKPFLKINKPIFVYDENGSYSQEILKIYGKDNK